MPSAPQESAGLQLTMILNITNGYLTCWSPYNQRIIVDKTNAHTTDSIVEFYSYVLVIVNFRLFYFINLFRLYFVYIQIHAQ